MGSRLIRKEEDGSFDLSGIKDAVENSLRIIRDLR
jgi:hypothetical protein